MKDASLSRRNFIKAAGVGAGVVAGTALLSGAVGLDHSLAATDNEAKAVDPVLSGVSDIHVHAAPDVGPRLINELSFATEAKNAGYRAVMFKSNEWSCHDRAFLVREALPGFECFGSLCMNLAHGEKVNVHAAEKATTTTGKLCRCIWMPTQAAEYQVTLEKKPWKSIPVLSATGNVLPEVVRVMEICAEADIIFATGHSSPEESVVLARKAKEVGVKKFVVTHANSRIWRMTREQVMTVADLGGYIEYSYISCLWGPGTGLAHFERRTNEDFIAYAQIVPERSFISTDMGQVGLPHPVDAMRTCIMAMREGGVPQKDIDIMVRTNPAMLMGLEA